MALRTSIYTVLLSIFVSFVSFSQNDLTLSEIMFNPASGNNEFIELFNTSETNSIDLSGYKILYYTSNPDLIVDAGSGTILSPKSFAVILEGDYDFVSGIYNNIIPSSALILKISDNSFGTSGMANTSDRPVSILSPTNDTLEVYTYTANNGTAISDEKKILINDNSPTNWGNSLVVNGTPGYRNSISPLLNNLSITSFSISPAIILQGEAAEINLKAKNNGVVNAVSFIVEIYNDINFDSTANSNELLFTQQYTNLSPGDSITATHDFGPLNTGLYQLIGKIIFPGDEDSLDNKKVFTFTVGLPGANYNDVVINEIMYAPTSPQPEWIELFNRTESNVNIKKWKVTDNSSSANITNDDIIIQPGSFIVLSKDASVVNYYSIPVPVIVFALPVLNNTDDAVVLKDSLGVVIDSLYYFSNWGGSTGGRSLERIYTDSSSVASSNWKTSTSMNKATPGRKNSVTPKENDLTVSSFKPEMNFGIIGEAVNLTAIVKNIGVENSVNFVIKFYNDVNSDSIPQPGELINQFSGNGLTPLDSSIFELSVTGFLVGRNNYIAVVETSIDEDSTNNIALTNFLGVSVNEVRGDIVINEIMYAPTSPEPEWIEIFNGSDKTINLKNYKLADNNDTSVVVTELVMLNPGEFLVIAKDSSIRAYYSIQSKLVVKSFPALNNDVDKVILLDSLNRTIDSLQYYSRWGGGSGRSLERIEPELNSIDSSSWGTSKSMFKATPGYINSLTQKDFDISVERIIFNPAAPVFGENVTVSTKVKNVGKNNAQFIIELYEDTNLDSIPDTKISGSEIVNLAAGDSLVYQFNYTIQNLQSEKGYMVGAVYLQDDDTTNNNFYATIAPGYSVGSIVVNEIMFTPSGGEPEWVELFNLTSDVINLKEWSVSDVLSTPATAKITQDVFFEPQTYLVLSKDSSIVNYHRIIPTQVVKINLPSFNNDVDGVVLKDKRGAVIDSVLYNSNWGGNGGYSLERKEKTISSNLSTNWSSSIDVEQSTPGRVNSISPKEYDLILSNLVFNPKSPVEGDTVFIIATVKNNGSSAAQNFSISFYTNRDSNNVADSLLAAQTGYSLNPGDSIMIQSQQLILNLMNKVIVAANVVFLNDEDTLNNYIEKYIEPGYGEKSIVITEIMYDPKNNEPEWFEIFNRSDEPVNLKNWAVSDYLTTPTKTFLVSSDYSLQPKEFVVVSKDSSLHGFYQGINMKLLVANFGTLANTTDGIFIYDFRNAVIDSVVYKSAWGGRNGYSLERVDVDKISNDSSNWVSSLSKLRATPGNENSVFNAPDHKRFSLIINEIMYDTDVSNNEFVEFYNASNDTLNLGGWRIEDEKKTFYRLADTNMFVPPGEFFVLISDTLPLNYYQGLDSYSYKTVLNVTNLGLVNTGELILLKDLKGNVIDSVWYSDKWHNRNVSLTKNKSLEKINPALDGNSGSNWSTSVSVFGATPGAANSIFTDNKNRNASISVDPNPFSPDNDGFEDFTIINFNLSQPVSQVNVKIFDNKGRPVRNLANNQPAGSSGSITFDGLDDNGNPLRIGIYIVYLEALNENSGVIDKLKTALVVARKL
ncbi:MAG TPA: lamin tail domain-containing protein [Ignavibacteriaceae bacterium]|jgi:hypothetical protein|nr:lamin tail domain-containing protein [Ignavibacteriaceae bacterium]